MERRDILRGALAFTLGAPTAAFVVHDPVLAAIKDYQHGWKQFMLEDDSKADQLCHLWTEPHDRLSRIDCAATTKEGALEALRVAFEENEVGDSSLTGPLIKAALGYFEAA